MFDVGACRGSSLRKFAEDAWTVHAFEPDPVNRSKLEEAFGEFPKVLIDPRAVTDKVESEVPLYRSDVSVGISALSPFHPSHKEAGTVQTVTLDLYCREKLVKDIDFLKVDTEGYDLFVLYGVPWKRTRPRVIMCEFEDRKTVPLGYSFHDLAKYLLRQDYHLLISEWYPVVEYGGSHRWRRFAPYPCELMDQQACGNVIAVSNGEDFSQLLRLSNAMSTGWKLGNKINTMRRLLKA
jgi:FkbM family methyltransferase